MVIKMEENKNILEEQKLIDKVNKNKIRDQEKIKSSYFYSIGVFFFSVLSFISTSIYFYYSYYIYTPPASFIVLNGDNKILEEISLKEDNMSIEELNNLINEWVRDILDYNYLNFDQHGSKIKKYFSNDIAYRDFMNVFQELRIQTKILANKGIVTTKVINPIVVENQRIYNDYQKVYQMRGSYALEMVFVNGIEPIRYEIFLNVTRQRLVDNPYGIAIETISLR